MNAIDNVGFTAHQVYLKLSAWCAYQDRCYAELEKKIATYPIDEETSYQIISKLREENFIDEARFARSFAGGKFRIKQWGKLKIAAHLKARQIGSRLISEALEAEIPDDDYRTTLHKILASKLQELTEETKAIAVHKAKQFAFQKGYEIWLITDVLNELEPRKKSNLF